MTIDLIRLNKNIDLSNQDFWSGATGGARMLLNAAFFSNSGHTFHNVWSGVGQFLLPTTTDEGDCVLMCNF